MYRSQLDLQRYVCRAGDQVFTPPFELDGGRMLLFVLKAEPDKLNKLLTRELNDPWQTAFALRGVRHSFRASNPYVVVVVSQVDEVYPAIFKTLRGLAEPAARATEIASLEKQLQLPSSDSIEAMSKITASQRELLVMVPLEDLGPEPDAGDVRSSGAHLWYLPIVLNDFAPAVLAGRELFGYPKLLATFGCGVEKDGKPVLFDRAGALHADLSIKTHGPTTVIDQDGTRKAVLDWVEVLRITRSDGAANADGPNGDALASDVKALFNRGVEFLFLRQFRDPQFAGRASYQAAVTSAVTAAIGPVGNDLTVIKSPQYHLQFPKLGDDYPSLVSELGILKDANDGVVAPAAVFSLQNQNLVVTSAEILWDRS